jgi:hypothetical protein
MGGDFAPLRGLHVLRIMSMEEKKSSQASAMTMMGSWERTAVTRLPFFGLEKS